MTVEQFYERIGGDYRDAKARLINDDFMKKFILKFADDPNYNQLLEAVKADDREKAFSRAHTLKGLVLNMGFAKISEPVCELVEQLRLKAQPADEQLIDKVKEYYSEIIENIDLL